VGGVTGSTDDFNEGVTPSNDLTSGTLTFAVPSDAPANLFYQCAIHSFMTGSIQVVAATAVPALGTLTAILLALALGGIGLVVYRRRLRSVS
jgi:lysozyme family protein